LTPETVLDEHRDWPVGTHDQEPLVDLAESGLLLLHSYRRAGLRGAIDRQYLRETTLDRLLAAAESLPRGFGLAVFDAWRPLALQRELFAACADLPPGAVAPPSDDPRTPPPHLTGGTVDLTLTWQGTPLALGTEFDDFGPRAAADAFEEYQGYVRGLRRMLYCSLRDQQFVVLAEEWWHYEFGTRLWSLISGNPVHYTGITPESTNTHLA
jgi:D-alanyl-D-alanine dipeptidase